jgi:S1-C subfamily serine protease
MLGYVAGSTRDILKGSSIKESLNVFSLKPESLFILKAPTYDLLPLIKSPTKISTQKDESLIPPSTSPSLLKKPGAPLIQIAQNNPEKSVVNIFCAQKLGNLRRIITGSGVLIHKDGTVLTNAHVAQFPLLSEKNPAISCMARHGNPAQSSLAVKTAYVSPEWLKTYGKYVNTEGAPQTGKSDFALLKIEMPATGLYPISVSSTRSLGLSSPVSVVAYPANILDKNGPYSSLFQRKEDLSVNRIYSVGSVENDIIETTGSITGQKGSSGGALIDSNGNLVGIIATVVQAEGQKTNIRGISIPHIDNELSNQSGYRLKDIINHGSSDIAGYFNTNQKTILASLLNTYLNSR